MGCYRETYTPPVYTPAVIGRWITHKESTKFNYAIACVCDAWCDFSYTKHFYNGMCVYYNNNEEIVLTINGNEVRLVAGSGYGSNFDVYSDWEAGAGVTMCNVLYDVIDWYSLDTNPPSDMIYRVFTEEYTHVTVDMFFDSTLVDRDRYIVHNTDVNQNFIYLYDKLVVEGYNPGIIECSNCNCNQMF